MTAKTATEERVRVVKINRPEARNAVNPAKAQALFAAMLNAEANPDIDAAILVGKGEAFYAGFDLKAAAGPSAGDWIARVDVLESRTTGQILSDNLYQI